MTEGKESGVETQHPASGYLFLFKARHLTTLGSETPERSLVPSAPIRKILFSVLVEADQSSVVNEYASAPDFPPSFLALWGVQITPR